MNSSLWLQVVNVMFLFVNRVVGFVPCHDFCSHSFIEPKVYGGGEENREILSTKEAENETNHVDRITLMFNFKGKNVYVDLTLNRDLIGENYFEKYQKDGGYTSRKIAPKDVELCHYNGRVRGIENSWVAVSTCDGVRGVMFDGNETHYIEKFSTANSSLTDTHVVYSHSDLRRNFTCGLQNDPSPLHSSTKRMKREANSVHGPYNANKLSRYIELVMVVDNREYMARGRDVSRVHQHCRDLANIINSLYEPLNIFVALIGVVIWAEQDEITLDANGDKTLTSFLLYRKDILVKEHPNDNAQLLTKLQFDGGVVGKALKGTICTYEFSGGVNVDHSSVVGLVATTIAHEMGHNLGMEHDTENDCVCPRERCIMSPSSSSSSLSPTDWSSCSRERLAVAFEHGMDYCLRNKPTSLFEGPVCGNGFVEDGEECDCGLKEKCQNACCNATTCRLHANATCATGKCCDLKTCQLHVAGIECRSAEHECDLPEYCSGKSEYCPNDVFKIDGEPCAKGTAYCYQGNCRSHSGQCKILWGPSGQSSDAQCYKMNTKGNRHGNCGYDRLNQTYIKCEEENVQCGMLQCKHLNERLEFGIESAAIISHSFISSGKMIIPCRTALVDFGLNEIDPGLAPDGAKCGDNHMCINKKCMAVDSLRAAMMPNACPNECSGNGVCNSKGHCHCNKGYAPPDCDSWGGGGSEDSGPAEPYTDRLRIIFWYMMLALVPLLMALLLYSYYVRKSPSYFWKRNQRRTVHCDKSVQIHIARNDVKGGAGLVGSPIQSLLSKANGSVHVKDDSAAAAAAANASSLKENLVGNFKGFSIVPLGSGDSGGGCGAAVASSPAKSLPRRPAPVPGNVTATKSIRKAPTAPPTDDGAPAARPSISSPVLDDTSSTTARKMINAPPLKSAPPPPRVAVVRPSTTAAPPPPPPDKSSNYSQALGRIASFVTKNVTPPTPTPPPQQPPSLASAKAAKIDRDTLKRLKISDPIPLSEPSFAVEPLPLTKDQERTIVQRANSLRYGAKKTAKPAPAFGSMRAPAGVKRPTSTASCSRPTSPPPPCPPPPSSAVADHEDAIYATIEESPPLNGARNDGSVLGGGSLLSEIVNEIKTRNAPTTADGEKQTDEQRLYANMSYYDTDSAASKSDSSSASSSDYLRPIKTTAAAGRKAANDGDDDESELAKLRVPRQTAPTYKPFSVPRKPVLTTRGSGGGESESSSQETKAPETSSSSGLVDQRAAEMESKTLDDGAKSSVRETFGVKLQPATSRSTFGKKTDGKS